MSNKAERKTISTIGNFFFEIPPYQRLYEWEKEQIETLLEDVKKACFDTQGNPQDNIYFIGNVVVNKRNGKYILIDGQQRLTTLFLIGVYLASKEKEETESWSSFVKNGKQIRISMPLREEEEKWLLDFIKKTRGKSFGDNLRAPNSIHEKILGGLKTIQTWFEQNFKDNQEKEGDFSTFLYNKVCFALVELAEGTDLNQFFVRMNNRGKQLEKHEILKARLLNIIKKDINWQKYAKIWDLCSDMDKYIFQSASDRKFLGSFYSANVSKTQSKKEPILLNILNNKLESSENDGLGVDKNEGIERVRSIIDFSTFLLHAAKLYGATELAINKDKLLDLIVVDKDSNGSVILSLKKDKEEVKKFILAVLTYRVLFDYFVIKRVVDKNLSKSGEYSIRRLVEDSKGYFSIGGSVMTKLAMIQNYLRVARAGDRQNYHHWLTPFLKKVSMDVEIKRKVKKICSAILNSEVDIKAFNQIKKSDDFCVGFLEGLDTDLAYAQMGWKSKEEEESGSNINDSLLFVTNRYLGKNNGIKWKERVKIDNWLQENLNQGTGTPHYWFYRLEYYLWKNRRKIEDKLKINNKSFDFKNIASEYHFRGLNSIEHIWPQSKEDEKGWKRIWDDSNSDPNKCYLDDFGNLALISQSFNSSLSDQSIEKKFVDVKERVRDNRVESLKMCLVYAGCGGENSKWTPKKAKDHQNKMLEVLKASLKDKK